MRRFDVRLVMEVDLEDGDQTSDQAVHIYKKHLADIVQDAAQNLSLQMIDGHVESITVTEIERPLASPRDYLRAAKGNAHRVGFGDHATG